MKLKRSILFAGALVVLLVLWWNRNWLFTWFRSVYCNREISPQKTLTVIFKESATADERERVVALLGTKPDEVILKDMYIFRSYAPNIVPTVSNLPYVQSAVNLPDPGCVL
jgi:hypothetical protein